MTVIVVGAGVIGSAVARELAADRDIRLIDRAGIASEATGRSAGLVAPSLFYGDLPDAARHANAFFRRFDGTGAFTFTERERLDLVEPAAESAARVRAERVANDGFPVAFLAADEVVDEYPVFRMDGFAGAIRYGDTGWIDPYAFTMALAEDARTRGAAIELGTEMTGLSVRNGAVRGVETSTGVIEADTVVVAAGWRTPALLDGRVDLPVKPFRTQVVVLAPDRDVGEELPLVRVSSEHLYLRPEHTGDVIVGGGRSVLADPESARTDVDAGFRRRVAAVVPELLDGFGAARFVNGWAGVDGATPDGRPIIDRPETAPAGVVVATGFNGLGVMAAPLAPVTVRAHLDDEAASFSTDPFALSRFDGRTAGSGFRSTADM